MRWFMTDNAPIMDFLGPQVETDKFCHFIHQLWGILMSGPSEIDFLDIFRHIPCYVNLEISTPLFNMLKKELKAIQMENINN
jgi:hypothetical protein